MKHVNVNILYKIITFYKYWTLLLELKNTDKITIDIENTIR